MCVYLPGLPGDLILISPPHQSFNTCLQSLFRIKKARHSHVCIVLEQYNLIHAMPKSGVTIESIREILKNSDVKFQVFRNVHLQNEEAICQIKYALLYFLRQRYNYRFFFQSPWHSSFCSELASRAFEAVGISISNLPPKSTLPTDIYTHITQSSDWIDVTELFKYNYLSTHYKDVYDVAANFIKAAEYLNQDMSFGQQQLLDKVNFVTANSENPTNYKPPKNYWSNELGKKFSLTLHIRYRLMQLLSLLNRNGSSDK